MSVSHADWRQSLTRRTVVLHWHLQRQVGAERERQHGWVTVCASSGNSPERLPPGGELIYGPPGAHLAMDGAA